MKPNVILYKTLPADLHELLAQHTQLTCFDGLPDLASPAFKHALANADGLIGTPTLIDDNIIHLASHLKVISTISVGYDLVDLDCLNRHNIKLMNTPDVLTDTVADLAFALILSCARRVPELHQWVKSGYWQKNVGEQQFGDNISGKSLGIIGLGRIGHAIAQRAFYGFNMPIYYYNRSRKPDLEQQMQAQYLPLDQLLNCADFVCIVLPYSPETHHLIGHHQLSQMRSSAYLINIGRGAVIDEAALIDALKSGQIRGAGLDVFEQEPLPFGSPLLSLNNVITLPHIGSATHETRYAMAKCAVENLLNGLTGNFHHNCVN